LNPRYGKNRIPDFESGAFDHSAIPPAVQCKNCIRAAVLHSAHGRETSALVTRWATKKPPEWPCKMAPRWLCRLSLNQQLTLSGYAVDHEPMMG
jgi:hypothetical protein